MQTLLHIWCNNCHAIVTVLVWTFWPLLSLYILIAVFNDRATVQQHKSAHSQQSVEVLPVQVHSACSGWANWYQVTWTSVGDLDPQQQRGGWPRHTSQNNYWFCYVTSYFISVHAEWAFKKRAYSSGSPLSKTLEVGHKGTRWLFSGWESNRRSSVIFIQTAISGGGPSTSTFYSGWTNQSHDQVAEPQLEALNRRLSVLVLFIRTAISGGGSSASALYVVSFMR